MHFNLTLIERMILESLRQNHKTAIELSLCTKLENNIVHHVLTSLISKNLITLGPNRTYGINKELNKQIINELNDKNNMMVEISEIVNSCIRSTLNTQNKNFKLKKVNMSEKEEKIFNGLLYNLESFLNELPQSRENKTADQKLIFWGEENYGKVVQDILAY